MLQCLQKIANRRATKVTYHTPTRLATSQGALSVDPSHHVRQSKEVSTSRKPVILRKFSREWCAGYAETTFPEDSLELEILDVSGKLSRIDWASVKWVCYVRELGLSTGAGMDGESPERLIRRRFSSRPRTAGLWLRLVLNDGEELEGMAANDRSLVNPVGLFLTPPDTRSNTQRIFVPRPAIRELTVLAVISLAPKTSAAARDRQGAQPELFANENVGDPAEELSPDLN